MNIPEGAEKDSSCLALVTSILTEHMGLEEIEVMRAHRTNIKQRQSPTSGATLPRPVHVYLLRYTAKEYILRNAGSKLRENPFHEANLYISDDVENKMQILFFFKKRIQLETMRNNGKLNGVPLWSLLMGVVIQEVLQYSFERGLIAR